MTVLFPIVEGHGDVRALPILMRRLLHEIFFRFSCSIAEPYRLSRPKILDFGDDLLKAVRLGESKIANGTNQGGIIILADADDDCPADAHQCFEKFRNDNRLRFEVGFVLAKREYESWFISGAEFLRAHSSVNEGAQSHPNPEAIRDAKGYFEREILLPNVKYAETVDQEKFSALIDLKQTHKTCRSFRKLQAEVDRLTIELDLI
jgi:hypothetical protein